jgi:hypothetical protein
LHHILVAIGFLASLAGLALLVRYGFRYRSRLQFDGTMPPSDGIDGALLEQHNRDVRGRFGFWLVVFGVLVLSFANYCPWMPH